MVRTFQKKNLFGPKRGDRSTIPDRTGTNHYSLMSPLQQGQQEQRMVALASHDIPSFTFLVSLSGRWRSSQRHALTSAVSSSCLELARGDPHPPIRPLPPLQITEESTRRAAVLLHSISVCIPCRFLCWVAVGARWRGLTFGRGRAHFVWVPTTGGLG